MRFTLKTLAMLLAVLIPGAAWAVSFTASLDRDTLTLGETATLSLRFDGELPQAAPSVPSIDGLAFGIPSQNKMNMNFNGIPSAIMVLSYPVVPRRDGEFTIPALTVEVGGQRLSSTPLKLTVRKASTPSASAINSGNELAFLKLNFPKPKVYVGEAILARLELYLREEVQDFGGFQITSSSTDGLSVGNVVELPNQRQRVQVGNRVFTMIPFTMPVTIVKPGELAIGPFTANVVVLLPLPPRNNGFFIIRQNEQRQIALATDSLNIQSLPLPAQNQPVSFSGAVGQFDMAVSAGPTTVAVGDPITVRVQISGRGALDAITLPAQEAWKSFKSYPPTAKLEPADQFGFQGTKTFEQIISPLNSDVHELPALAFSFFNPEDGQYHTLTQPAMPLVVKAAGATPLPQMVKNQAEEKPAQDILPIKDKFDGVSAKQIPLVARPVFLAAQAVPVLAFFAAFIWRKRADNLANNPRLRRQRAVASLISSGKSDLKKFAAANKPDEFFATLFRLLQEQLGERLDCPASAITENVVEENAVLRGASDHLRNALREQFQLCNQARYAPVRGTSELNSVAAQFEQLLDELQNLKS